MSYFDYKPKSDPINWEWGIKRPNNGGWWYNVSQNFNLTQDDVRMNRDYIRWHALSENRRFPFDDDFLAEFEDRIHWIEYVNTHKISEKTFLRFRKHISVYMFLAHTSENKNEMAEKYFEEADKVGKKGIYVWDKKLRVSERVDILMEINGLSDKFLETHAKSKDDWYVIARYRRLSKSFIKKHIQHLSIEALLANDRLNDNLKEDIAMGVLK